MSAGAGKKRIVIKPFRTQVQMDTSYAEKVCCLLLFVVGKRAMFFNFNFNI